MASSPLISPTSSPTSPTAPPPPPAANAPPPTTSTSITTTTTTTTTTSSGTSTDKNATAPSMSEEEITTLLLRLAQKDTVTSVMVLTRSDGAIVRVAGALANPIDSVGGGDEQERGLVAEYAGVVWRFVKASEEMLVGELGRLGGLNAGVGGERAGGGGGDRPGEGGAIVDGVDDDLKLLRVRTRRGELVIVPEGRFILVLVHDTPGK